MKIFRKAWEGWLMCACASSTFAATDFTSKAQLNFDEMVPIVEYVSVFKTLVRKR